MTLPPINASIPFIRQEIHVSSTSLFLMPKFDTATQSMDNGVMRMENQCLLPVS